MFWNPVQVPDCPHSEKVSLYNQSQFHLFQFMTVTSHLLTIHQCKKASLYLLDKVFVRRSAPAGGLLLDPTFFQAEQAQLHQTLLKGQVLQFLPVWGEESVFPLNSPTFISIFSLLESPKTGCRSLNVVTWSHKCWGVSDDLCPQSACPCSYYCTLGCSCSLLPGHAAGSCSASNPLAILVAHSSSLSRSIWMKALPSNVLTSLPFWFLAL